MANTKIVLNDGLTLFKEVVANTTATIDPASMATVTGSLSSGLTVTGAAFGDHVILTAPYDLQGVIASGFVSAANTVKVSFFNPTGGTIDLASGSYKILVVRF
ncbi:hypothetical protein [Paenibacillus contaminans]|uniref:Uncharacterized protein n=1 Tax=Paenibacillus contaminans TaxID=450362 RepID=A0A329MS76_9BACL|nr:hypothetical protein [Paenibacillus contaminans]RAV22206.1 hypothetical protein DQG23_04440 [Paenibacillus contaminans]